MKINKKMGIKIPPHWKKKAQATRLSEMMYPKEPIYISCLLPSLSINEIPTNVKIKLVKPMPMLLSNDVLSPNPPSSKILGA